MLLPMVNHFRSIDQEDHMEENPTQRTHTAPYPNSQHHFEGPDPEMGLQYYAGEQSTSKCAGDKRDIIGFGVSM